MRVAGPNVLISSAGRRVGLVRAFQEVLGPRGGKVVATDHRPEMSAACQVANRAVRVPLISDPEFTAATLAIAAEESVGLVIPTLDTELQTLATVRRAWADQGVHIAVSDPEFVAICRDKRRTAMWFESVGISALREVVADEFPRFVKPVAGSLSGDVHVVPSGADLPARLEDRHAFVHQELVDRRDYEEFTVDALYSGDSTLVCAVPRQRIEVRGGEISKGRTTKGRVLSLVVERLHRVPGARGCLTIQLFHSPEAERELIGVEVNARFGGGYPMSHSAGARFSQWLVEETMEDRALHYRDDWADAMTFLRYDEHVLARG